ncbi:MAG: peptidoglycan DD-metalloendopeptidase family protein [Alphaproteobacteria bacterium]|nr:peptidoglycan DD-metalloendopeptidase family protein [Alphaproteobacteria bacterium]
MSLTKWGAGAAALAAIFAIGFGEVSDAHRPASAPTAPGRADAEAALTLASGTASGAQVDFLKWAHAFSSSEPEDRLALAVRTGPEDRYVEVSRGDTLMGILTDNGVDRGRAYEAIARLGDVFDVRRLQIGQGITLTFAPVPAENDVASDLDHFIGLSLRPDAERDISVIFDASLGDGGFVASEEVRALTARDGFAEATITSSLYEAAIDAGMPVGVLMDMIRVFSFDVDFQRDIQEGDSFRVMYEDMKDEFGVPVRTGDVIYASMTLSGKTKTYYRYTPKSGITDYFDEQGRSVRKTLMRTPVDGARLSSGFGKRRHPVLGYTKMHKGVDFAAPRGTPIMAAGDGVVERANRYGGYGNYLRIRHNSELKTAYAHIHRFAKGVSAGSRVKQGQIVAYVGSTGRSTGPHLHYEVLHNMRQVNPLSVKLPAGETLKGGELKRLAAARSEIDQRVAASRNGTTVASVGR